MIHFVTFIEASYMICSTPPDTDAISFGHLSSLGLKERKKKPSTMQACFQKTNAKEK